MNAQASKESQPCRQRTCCLRQRTQTKSRQARCTQTRSGVQSRARCCSWSYRRSVLGIRTDPYLPHRDLSREQLLEERVQSPSPVGNREVVVNPISRFCRPFTSETFPDCLFRLVYIAIGHWGSHIADHFRQSFAVRHAWLAVSGHGLGECAAKRLDIRELGVDFRSPK